MEQRPAKYECATNRDSTDCSGAPPTEPRASPPCQPGFVYGPARLVKLSLSYHRSPSIIIAVRQGGLRFVRAEHRGPTLIHRRDR